MIYLILHLIAATVTCVINIYTQLVKADNWPPTHWTRVHWQGAVLLFILSLFIWYILLWFMYAERKIKPKNPA